MSKLSNISGFPEWLPEEKLVEEKIIEEIARIYRLHGFTPIETPAVELFGHLSNQGEVSKEIYVLQRAQAEKLELGDSSLALHFDLTVPFARYVALHQHKIDFPFKRYQLQKAWRGERPQEGRFREFYQFDIDTIARDELPLCHDAEIVSVVDKVFCALKLGKHFIRINNRKILLGLYTHLGLDNQQSKAAVVAVDKIDKIGPSGVTKELSALGLKSSTVNQITEYATVRIDASEGLTRLDSLNIDNPDFSEGCSELSQVLSLIPQESKSRIKIDLSLARGMDYYTGTILETYLNDYTEFGSVCGGGRYDNLASRFTKQKLPGVGVSIGLTRLLSLVFSKNLIPCSKKSPSQVLVTVLNEEQRNNCNAIAEKIRANEVACEVFHKALKLGKQIDYADKKGIRYVVFAGENGVEVKDLISKEQVTVDLDEWCTTLKADSPTTHSIS